MRSTKGKYEMFQVGDELVFSDSRNSIREYALENGYTSMTYQMSSDKKESFENIAKEV